MAALSTAGRVLVAAQSDTQLITRGLPVDGTSQTWRRLYRLVTGGLQPGDLLDIDADARVTNDCGRDGGTRYTIGVGWHLWAYSYTDPLRDTGPWWQISHLMGDNVDAIRHHMPLHISCLYQVPDDWPPDHRMVIVLQADAHSTKWAINGGKDLLTVDDGYGQLIVRHWTTPTT
ncbi:hypothetical protein [Streptomyces globisporus]